jgi:D-alanyl-D-alanine carboxypeptidase/D-alanyl-D-alanine-endopeptidase (penicillin-binding protein 4)
VEPTADGASVRSDPLPAGLVIENRIRRGGNGACGDPTTQLNAGTTSTGGLTRLNLSGSLAAGCTEAFDWNLAPLPPERLFEGMFRSLWKELGGEIGGHFQNGSTPPDARLLAETNSPPLPEVLRDMNKWSNNVIARHVLATLGATAEPEQDSVAAGGRVVEQSLRAGGVDTSGFVIENGAGLSRSARISAHSLGQLLLSAWRSPTMPELLASLPIAGVDGTARRRLANSPAAGHAHIKTGTLDGVRSLAGYVLARDGQRYAVVLMINHPNAGATRDAQDALLEWVTAR